MKRLCLLTILLIAGNSFLTAQEYTKSRIINLQAGIVFPLSDFARNSSEDEHPGFATAGGNVEAEYISFGNNITGICVDLGYAWMGFDSEAYLNSYSTVFPEPVHLDQSGNYKIIQAGFGLLLHTSVGNNTRLMFIPSIGLSAISHPEISVTGSESAVLNSIQSTVGYSGIIGFKIKAGYDVTERLGISLCYHLKYASPYFEDSSSPEGIFWLPVQYHGVLLGVYYNLTGNRE